MANRTVLLGVALLCAACQRKPAEPSGSSAEAPKLPPPVTYSSKLIQFDKDGKTPINVWLIEEARRSDGSTYRADKREPDPLRPQARIYFVNEQKLVTVDPETGARFEKPSRSAFRQPKPLKADCLEQLGAPPGATCEPANEKLLGYSVHRYQARTGEAGRKYELSSLVAGELGWLPLREESRVNGILERRLEVTAVKAGEPEAALFDVSKYALKDEAEFIELARKSRGIGPAGK
jgi:hypothetical protein